MRRFFHDLWSDETGQDATEYALLVVFIGMAIMTGMTAFSTGMNGALGNASSTISTAGS